MQNEIKSKIRTYTIVAILLSVILGVFCYSFGVVPQTSILQNTSILKPFSSETELKSFLTTRSQNQGSSSLYKMVPGIFDTLGETPSFSTTNIQVSGVDEADTVKTDGEYLYTVTGSNISILKAYPPQEVQLISTLALGDIYPSGIFATGDRLVVLGNNYSSIIAGSAPLIVPYYFSYYYGDSKAYAQVYDTSNKSDLRLLRTFAMTGNYVNSRMIGKYVYFVISQPAYVVNDTVFLPSIYSGGKATELRPTEVYYSNFSDSYLYYTTFIAMNIQDTAEEPTSMTVTTGVTSNMYVSLNNIYVTFPERSGETSIYRIRMENNNLTCEAEGTVPGHELDQFSMDEYGDYFRIVTTDSTTGPIRTGLVTTNITIGPQHTNLYVLNMNMSVVGKLENISAGENMHSSRFLDDRCYLVTFQKTDPLFVIDLRDPTNPAILGELRIPGYSDYLHPYDDTHIIGVGKETTEAEAGTFSWYQGIKISVFDVSNVSNPIQLSKYVIGDRGSDSPVLTDHKAFLFDKTKNLLVIPVTVAEIDASQYPEGVPSYAYGTAVWQGAYVFNITLTDGLVLRGNITHAEGSAMPSSDYYVTRALYIDNVLYTVSAAKVKLNNLDDLTFIKEIKLN